MFALSITIALSLSYPIAEVEQTALDVNNLRDLEEDEDWTQTYVRFAQGIEEPDDEDEDDEEDQETLDKLNDENNDDKTAADDGDKEEKELSLME